MPPVSPRSAGVHKPHPTHARLALLLCALLLAAGTADAQSFRPSRQYPRSKLKVWSTIAALKEITPGVGWVMLDEHLLWTDSDGAVWWDITPPRPATGDLSTVYALDSRHLWAAMLDTPRYSLEVPFTMSLFRTSNGGHTWSNLRFDATLFPQLKETNAHPLQLLFVDPSHGWFLWYVPTGTQVSFGILLSTQNGGSTWTELPSPPSSHGVAFYTAKDGWTTGQPDGSELWVTHDAGQTWTQKTVAPPDSCNGCLPIYNIPKFQNQLDGVVAITFVDSTNGDGRYVSTTYVTHDGGNSWQATDVFEKEDPYVVDAGSAVCEVDMDVVRVFSDNEHGMRIRTAVGAIEPPYPAGLPPRGSAGLFDFVDLRHGWLTYCPWTCTALMSTSDGGKTFKVISPTHKPTR
jgi:photosystem II stability/assembly factor-like uncharacterized protein